MGTRATRQDEVERKYDVEPERSLPVLTAVDGVASLGQQEVLDLEAVYFDTAGLDLHRHGISLRRRMGGVDDGWHLKLPREGDRRTEVHLPLGRSTRTVPARLLEPVRAVVRDRPLHPVATLTTHRLQHAVLDDEGHVLATVCDDQVEGQSALDPDRRLSWREVELELADGQPEDLLARLEVPLLEGGASRSRSTSKVRRVLGEPVDHDGHEGHAGADDGVRDRSPARGPRRGRKAKAAAVFLEQAEQHVRALHRHDRGVREGERRSVHQLRIAARRLRSTLDTFGPLMVPGSTDLLRAELRWLGRVLAPARDAEVLRQRLDRLVADQPAELVLGAVASRIDRDLAKARAAGAEAAGEALRSERYYRLLDLLDDAVRSPQWSGSAGKRAGTVLPRLLAKDARAVRRAARRAHRADGADRDLALHRVRKKAKRLRYAAETAQVVLGPGTAKLGRHAKRVQSALGDHHDTVVARAALRQWGIEAHLDGDNAFTFGLLLGLEQARAEAAERSFDAALPRLGKKRVRRELRR